MSGIDEDRVDVVYSTWSDALKKLASKEETRAMLDQINDLAGGIVEFLPQQWAFKSGAKDGADVIYSGKIVVHEKREYIYVFEFIDDGKFDKMNGFKMLPRGANEGVIAGMDRVIDSMSAS